VIRPVDWFHGRAAGVSLLLVLCQQDDTDTVPVLLHWGADLGELTDDDVAALLAARTPTVPHSALDRPRLLSVLPDNVSGFTGAPAVEGFRTGTTDAAGTTERAGTTDAAGVPWTPRFTSWELGYDDQTAAARTAARSPMRSTVRAAPVSCVRIQPCVFG